MTTSDTILLLLAEGKATTEAVADTLRQPAVVINAFLCGLETAGHAKSAPLGNPDAGRKLAVWTITESGKARAEQLKASA